MSILTCFKTYDVRGQLGEELNENIAYRIGRAFAQHLRAKKVVIGSDSTLSSDSLKQALTDGLIDAGADVIDIGQSGTEEVYFAAFHLDVDGGIEIKASHNPIDYNGMKFIGQGARPICIKNDLAQIKKLAETQDYIKTESKGILKKVSILDRYIDHLLGYVNLKKLGPLKLVVNAGNGTAGHVIDAIDQRFKKYEIPIEFIKIYHHPDGSFPNGIPNSLLPEKRSSTSKAVIEHRADMGIAWDGDFDRCFFFDEQGNFIEGYYIVGILAQIFLKRQPSEKIIHDARFTWNTIDAVKSAGGIPIQSKTEHVFIKERMSAEDAVYGGEMSAHHYFREFAYCDSGMIPWLMICELLQNSGTSFSKLVSERLAIYPCSGEINYQVKDAQATIFVVRSYYERSDSLVQIDTTDGLSMEFTSWRFNLRASNIESLLRLNLESRNDKKIIQHRLAEIEKLILG